MAIETIPMNISRENVRQAIQMWLRLKLGATRLHVADMKIKRDKTEGISSIAAKVVNESTDRKRIFETGNDDSSLG